MRPPRRRQSGGQSAHADARKLRVVHVLWRLSQGGGIPIVVRNLLARIDLDSVDVHVITLRPRLPDDRLDDLPPGVTVHALGFAGALRSWQRPVVALRVARLVRRLRPGVVQAHTGTAWMSALARLVCPRAPFVLEVHDAPGSGRHSRATDRFEGFLVRRLRYTALCHSTSVRSDIEKQWRVRAAQVELFPLGIDTAAFDVPAPVGAAWRAKLGLSSTRPIVLYVARLVPSKNVGLLIAAADRCVEQQRAPDEQPIFVVVAGGPTAELQAEIDRRGLGASFVLAGPMYLEELAAAYAAADVFCSTSDYEGFGLAIVEAMASGLPVVATAVGGVTDLVVPGETGTLVARGDVSELASAVSALLSAPELRRAQGEAGRARARELFDVGRMVRSFEGLYLRLAGRTDRT